MDKYTLRRRTAIPGDNCWRCGRPMPAKSFGNPLWLFRSDERSLHGQQIMRLFCSEECLKRFKKGEKRMNTTCKYCGKSLPREYAPGERSEFCTVVSGGKNKKDGSASSDRVMHFCSESCAKWKTYKDKVARAVGIGKSKRLSEAEISDMIDNLVKPDGVDPMAAETTEKPVQRPTEEPNNVPAEEEKPVETPAEAVKHAEEAKPMETPKKKRMVVMCREISMSGNHVEATLNAANATIKSLYIASEPETIDDLQACIEELTEVLDMMMKEAANGNA